MELLAGERYDVASHSIAAAYAGWLLRELGADVRHDTALDPEGPGTYPAEGATFADAPAIAADATNVVTDMPVTDANRRFLEGLAATARVTWITPWGLDNPWSERPWTDHCLQAAGGWMSAVGEPDREPIGPPDSQASFMAGLFGAVNALRHHADPNTGPGLSDIPMVECISATTIYDAVAFQYLERVRPRIGKRFGPAQPTLITLPCKDGYVGIHAALHGQWVTLANLIGHPELVDDPRFASPLERAAHTDELDAYILPWLAERTRFEAYHALQQARIPASATPSIPEVLASPQLAARNAWREVDHPSGKRVKVPGQVVRTDDTVEAATAHADGRDDGPWAPGRLRVVDLSMGWAGPMVSHILAGLGADVIKVESHTHFDWWRGSRPPGDDPSLALHERSHVFNGVNRGKRGVTLNLQTQAGGDLARKLIGSADVVVENFGAGVVDRLGLSYDTLKTLNPGLIMLQQPGFGTGGPESDYLTFGNTIEGMSGMTALTGYADGPPMMLSNALGDPVSGLTGTVSVLGALAARERDGRGRKLECAQLEGFLPLVSEAILRYQVTGKEGSRRGNVRPGHSPSGVYPAAGEDRWIAVEVRNDAEWQRLAELIGEDWARSPELAATPGREADRKLDARFAKWTAEQDRDELVDRLAEAGIAAAPVNNEADTLSGEPYASSGYWLGEEREPVGFHLYPTLPMRRDGTRITFERPAPWLGQHNEEVLAGLGLAGDAIARMRDEGVIGEQPVARERVSR